MRTLRQGITPFSAGEALDAVRSLSSVILAPTKFSSEALGVLAAVAHLLSDRPRVDTLFRAALIRWMSSSR